MLENEEEELVKVTPKVAVEFPFYIEQNGFNVVLVIDNWQKITTR
ncbi:hypothetical protein ACLN19_08210 [Streptococcus sp. zg-JUN1979]